MYVVRRIAVISLISILIVFNFTRAADPIVDARAGSQLQAAADYGKEGNWRNAVRLLQQLLDDKPEAVARLGDHYIGVHAAAERMLATMPDAGRAVYQRMFGRRAAEMLEQARKDHDAERFARVARRYLYTDSGPAALQGLARQRYRAGQFHFAANSYGKLIDHLGLARWSNDDLYQAAVVFHHRSKFALAERTLKQLLSRSRQNSVRVGERKLTAVQLRQEIEGAISPRSASEWPMYGGDVARSARGGGSPPVLEPSWRRSMIYQDVPEEIKESIELRYIHRVEKQLQKHHRPILTAFSPITVTATRNGKKKTLLIYKNYWGVIALDADTNKIAFAAPSEWSLQRMLSPVSDRTKPAALREWLEFYIKGGEYPQSPFDNSTIHTISSDGKFVYVVEDFSMPPPPEANKGYPRDIQDALRHSRLQAYSLQNAAGKLTWELGGDNKGPLADCYFLGPPLPLDGLLYSLVEKKQKLCLLCLDPGDKFKIVFLRPLVRMPKSLADDPYRRIRAAHLAYSDGILVCPSNAGVVVGIDVLSHGLAWVYSYDSKREHPKPYWPASAPTIAEGKVLFTPPDAPTIHCLNLHDGSRVWAHQKTADDLYLAGVHDGKALIVGAGSVRGVNLQSGAALWTLKTGTPSGRGAFGDDVYYLPLKASIRAKRPEIAVIDTNKGRIAAHIRSRPRTPGGDDFETPGNLLFLKDRVVSLTPREIVAYPLRKDKFAKFDLKLASHPNDPAALTDRAALSLDDGNLSAAIDDLRKALKNEPNAETRYRASALLFEVFTDLFKNNLADAEKYLPEYEALCKVDRKSGGEAKADKRRAEQNRRRQIYLRIVARLRTKQERLKEALRAYVDLAAVDRGDEIISPPDNPAVQVRRDVWIRERIAEMYRRTTPEQRKQLDEEMMRLLKADQSRRNVDDLHRVWALFGPDTAAGRETALRLAERLTQNRDRLEAELLLQQVRRYPGDAVRAARAVAMLGRLMTTQNLFADAVYYYRILHRDFAAIRLPNGKTGAETWDDVSADKRFFPYLDEFDPYSFVNFRARKEAGDLLLRNLIFRLEHEGEKLPFFHRHLVGLGLFAHDFHLRDQSSGKDRWLHSLSVTPIHTLLPSADSQAVKRFRYHTLGHLIVLPVGRMVFAVDPVARHILWEKNIEAETNAKDDKHGDAEPRVGPIAVDPRDGDTRIAYPDDWVQHYGHHLLLSPSALCLSTRWGLQAFEPHSGRLLWMRADVAENLRIFGDYKYVFVVEENAKDEIVSTRGLRLADGGDVPARAFADLFDKRVQVFGRTLLIRDKDADGAVLLRQYDIPTGADVWKAKYRSKSIVTRSEDASLAGVVEPDGKVHVVDLRKHKEVMIGQMDKESLAEHLRNVRIIHLLHDDKFFYFACQAEKNADKRENDADNVQVKAMARLGMRGVPVNGVLYSFERDSGKISWFTKEQNQFLILDQFSDLPVVVLAGRWREPRRNTQRSEKVSKLGITIIEKRSGRICFEDNIKTQEPIYALRFHARSGDLEIFSRVFKIVVTPAELRKSFGVICPQ